MCPTRAAGWQYVPAVGNLTSQPMVARNHVREGEPNCRYNVCTAVSLVSCHGRRTRSHLIRTRVEVRSMGPLTVVVGSAALMLMAAVSVPPVEVASAQGSPGFGQTGRGWT